MNDTITGVVVLQRMPEGGIWRLWFQYTKANGWIGYSSIPMKPKSDPEPAGRPGPLWDFVMENPTLHCSPSVRILGPRDGAPDHFHNAGQWSNPFVIMARPFGVEPDATEVCRAINEYTEKEDCDRVILEYRAKGVLE